MRLLRLAMAAGLALPSSLIGQRPPPMRGEPILSARVLGPAPSGLQISFGDPGVLIVWQGVTDPAGYRVYRSSDPAVAPTELTTAAIFESKFLDLTVAPGGVYYYSVAADYSDQRLGTSVPVVFGVPMASRSGGLVSPPVMAAPRNLPVSAPTNLQSSATPIQVTLSWNSGFAAQSYEVARVAPNGQATLLTQPAVPFLGTTFTDQTVVPGTSYRYDVTAIGAQGDRAVAQKTVIPPLPVNPTGLTSSVQLHNSPVQMSATLNVLFTNYGDVTVAWQPVPGATSYRVAGPNLNQYRQVPGTSTTIAQLPPGPVTYTVVAEFTNGQGRRFANDQAPASLSLRVGSWPVEGFGPALPGSEMLQWYDTHGATGFYLFVADRPGGPYVQLHDQVGATFGYHRGAQYSGRTYWYKVLSIFPSAPAALTEPVMNIMHGEHNLTGLETLSSKAGGVKIAWHPIAGAWYHVRGPGVDVLIDQGNWLNSEFVDVNTQSGKSYAYFVCATRIEPYRSPVSNMSKCAGITVVVP